VDGDQGLTNQGDGGTITVTIGWTTTGSQNSLTTRGNTTNQGQFAFPQSNAINTTFALVKGDSGWTTRQFATMWSGNIEHLGGGNASGSVYPYVISANPSYTNVFDWRHSRENGTQINTTSNVDWGAKSTDWRLYSFQSKVSDPWTFNRFGNDRAIANRQFSGEMAEILALEEELSLADIEKIEGYLMHKWGLEANLPSGHPYKSAAPTV
jgi:hypothetical protein